ncbi:MAG: CRISPR-associated helicase Cas3' [Oscillospiraceae bacterium]
MKYAAHIRKPDNEEQSVISHLCGTAKFAEKYAEKVGIGNLLKLAALMHDMGKFTEKFNEYIHGQGDHYRGEIDHSYAGAKFISEYASGMNDPSAYETAAFIGRIIISHHGLHDWLDENGDDCFAKRIDKDVDYNKATAAFSEAFGDKTDELFQAARNEYIAVRAKIAKICKGKKDFAFYLGMFERLAESMLIDADRTDTADFMSDSVTEQNFETQKVWEEIEGRLSEKLAGFSGKKDRISLRRTDISERCAAFADHKAGVCRLIVPTGGGKTLSSLRYAVKCCREYDMERIFYIAPFMSILEQNSDIIRNICTDEFFLEHHSNVLQETDSDEELAEYELRAEKWDKPVIATTMVQFLNALFLGKSTAVRRMHRLCNSVIIIDEVQTVPVKCINMFNLAVNFLAKICGSTVVLCSATQPVFDRTEFPVIFDEKKDITGSYSEDFEVFRRTKLIPALTVSGYSFEEAANFCYEKYLCNGSLLVVMNTKKSAAEIFRLIKQKNDNADEERKAFLIHLSNNMCPEHRKKMISEAVERLKRHDKVICVTTQLIEAGVDVSFGCVVRSMAGMDNAAQAAGRCNRNGEIDGVSPVYIINVRDERLAGLQEIKSAQDASRIIINSKKYEDMLLPEAMEAYFGKYYHEREGDMNFVTPDKKDNLVELLSLDTNRFVMKKKPALKYSAQAFKTAGEIFEVIDSETVGIIVPYNDDAKDLIDRLNCEIYSPYDSSKLIRKVQKYTVGVYNDMKNRLFEAGAVRQLKSGVLALEKRFYNDDIGITFDGAPPETLIF